MSVFNGGLYLNESIKSILSQTFEDFEFIIIDDGSSDSSQDVIRSYNDIRIKILKNKINIGLSAALNRGISVANGDFIVRMDADDVCYPDRLKKQYEFLMENPNCVSLGSNVDLIDKDGKYLYTSRQKESWPEIKKTLPITPFFHSSVMFRRDTALDCGGYCEEMLTAQDAVLFNRMTKYGELRNLPDVLMQYRLVPSSNSRRSQREEKKVQAIVNKAIENNIVSADDATWLKKITNQHKRKKVGYYYYNIGKIYLEERKAQNDSREYFFNALKYIPYDFKILFNLILSFLPLNVVSSWKNWRKNRAL